MSQFYGVWVGKVPGIYTTWDECKKQTDKFPKAQYKKLKATNYPEAEIEFKNGFVSKETTKQSSSVSNKSSNPLEGFLTVDGASNSLNCEFQAVWYPSGEVAFKSKCFEGGTNNIAEFLGLVFACKYLKDKNLPLNIYSDSVTALAWVRNKKANTTANQTGKATPELDKLITQAEKFLYDNEELMKKANILKWETKTWGEIPADFGRK